MIKIMIFDIKTRVGCVLRQSVMEYETVASYYKALLQARDITSAVAVI